MNQLTRKKAGVVVLAFSAFIALGMPDGLLGIAWPALRADFGLPLDGLGPLLLASVAGYVTSSFVSGALIARVGVGRVLVASCILTGTALISYTLVPAWWMMVAFGVLVGLGAGAIDAGLNTYVATHFGARLMQWLHASWGVGITSGPILMTMGLTQFASWRLGYRLVGSFQFAMAAAFGLTLSWWLADEGAAAGPAAERPLTDYRTPLGTTLREYRVWLSLTLFFLYVGSEMATGVWVFTLLTESRGVAEQAAGLWTGSYWGMFTVGRILAGLYANRAGSDALVQGGIGIALLGSLLLWWQPFPVANLIAVGAIGLAIAPVFPAMMTGTSRRVGARHAANTIGMQITATGLATVLVPTVIGFLAQRISLEVIPLCLVAIFTGFFVLYRLALAATPQPAAVPVAP